MLNFYNYIHTTLLGKGEDELIIWQSTNSNKRSVYTANELLKRVTAYRQQLLQYKSKQGQPILLAIPVSIEAVTALLAIQSIGAIPVLPPAKPGLLMLISVIRSQKIKTILTGKKPGIVFSFLLQLAGIKCIQLQNIITHVKNWTPVLVSAEQPALVTHSSGSTGKPKAIYRSHSVLSAQHLVLKKAFPPWNKQRDFPLFPNIILHNLAAGVTSIIPSIPGYNLKQLDTASIAAQLKSEHIETLTGNVYYFNKLIEYLKKNQQTFPSVKAVGIGGSPVPERLIHGLKDYFPNAECFIIYGSSEAEPIAVRRLNNTITNPLNGYAVGKLIEDLEIRIMGTTEIQTAQGVFNAGEIEVKGAHVATSKKEDWLRTGDFGYITKENELFLTARKGNEKPHKRIQHYQVEHLLLQHLPINNVAVKSEQDGFNIFLVGNEDLETFWQVLNKHLPNGIIKDVYFRSELHLDARHHSKILYDKLK